MSATKCCCSESGEVVVEIEEKAKMRYGQQEEDMLVCPVSEESFESARWRNSEVNFSAGILFFFGLHL